MKFNENSVETEADRSVFDVSLGLRGLLECRL